MNKINIMLTVVALISGTAIAATPHYIDLTHAYGKDTLSWPTAQHFKITKTYAGTNYGFYVSVRDFSSNEHAGTHIDAPNHFAKGRIGVSNIPLDHLIGPAVKIDVSQAVIKNHDYQIGKQDIENWESTHGKIPPQTIILFSTGYGKYWPNQALYSGTKRKNEESLSDLHFPGLSPKGALWLITDRKVKAVGIDTYSIDHGQTKLFQTHQILTKHDIPIFENVADMSKVPAKDFKVYALPMKIEDGTGAPLRIIAETK